MKPWTLVLTVAVFALVVAVASACDGDDKGEPTVTATVAPTTTPAATGDLTATPAATGEATVSTGRTSIPEVDAFIDALIADHGKKETPALAALIGFTQIPCTTTPEGIGAPPLCELNEEEGELVEVFEYGACEGEYLRPHQIDRVLNIVAQSSLYAVYRAPLDHPFADEYVAVIADDSPERTGLAWEVEIEGGSIVSLHFSCAAPPQELVALRGLEDAVLPPESP
ncbi:MAG: hypothetical protein A2148_03950 [Chloroflexi bacterium RBG_16_68_14]|nr:MAG: hypothetical protein A2148_03950 [Chloroflexi bacterium RBG_16_68_14]